MNTGLSDKIREIARENYVIPAIRAGKNHLAIPVRDFYKEGIPARNTPQICSSLQSAKFLRQNGLEIEEIEGPPKKVSPTVVFRYRVEHVDDKKDRTAKPAVESRPEPAREETPEEWAHRVTGKLRGLLKEELAEYGGAEGFIRWVRGYDEEEK